MSRLLLLATVLVTLAVCASAQTSILDRFHSGATDVLGRRLKELIGRLDGFRDPIPPVSTPPPASGTTAKPAANAPVYPVQPVGTTRTKADSSMIILHGLDSSPDDLVLLTTFARQWLPTTRFVLPKAPVVPVTYLKKKASSWFDIFQRLPGRENEKELRAAARGVARLVRLEKTNHGIDSDRVIVLGMSQGGAVALTFYLQEEIKVAGVIAAATWLPIPTKWKTTNIAKANALTKLLMLHGDRDDVIPIAEATKSMEQLRRFGREVRWIRYPRGGHTLVEEGTKLMLDILQYSQTQLNGP